MIGVAVLTFAAPGRCDPLLRVAPLERDRASPSHPAKKLPLQTEPGKVDYLLYNHLRQDDPKTPILYLKIPEQYVGRASASVHNFGVHFSIWYPEMTGSLNPENKERIKCLGYCNGKIDVFIENRTGIRRLAETKLIILREDIEKERASKSPTVIFKNMTDDNALEHAYAGRHVEGPFKNKTFLYFIRRSKEGKLTHFAKCMPDVPSPACDASMELPEHPGTSINYSFSMSLLKDWTKVQQAVHRTVSSFFVTSFHP